MKTKHKVTINFVVRIKNCKKDFGLGKGVIGTQETVFTDEQGRGFDNFMFFQQVLATKQNIVDNLIEVEGVVVKAPKGKLQKINGTIAKLIGSTV